VTAGALIVDGSIASSSGVTVEDGATLGGGGTVSDVEIRSGGTLAAGASAGILNTGSIALAAGAMFEAEIGGTNPGPPGSSPGAGYDQVKVTGAVSLGGATLDASLIGGFVPTFGQAFIIIDNDGNDAVTGTFAGLAEGAVVEVGGTAMQITYEGGDGNDVALMTGVVITGTGGDDLVNAIVTVPGQPFPTNVGDLIKGRGGKDSLSGLGGDDEIHGGKGADLVRGDAGDDLIFGERGRDALNGGAGNDMLNGGPGSDRLTGGEGDDTFVFANPKQPDRVTDWTQGDVIALAKSAFKAIGPKGVLAEDRFHIGSEAETKKQKILYDDETGWLSYARKGSDTANPLAFARIGKGLTDFDHTDIMVI
jgi:Ca2+-binding RTX toxin-like protein